MALTPVFQLVPVPSGAPKGGLNCNAATGALAVAHATGNAERPAAADVRALCRNADGSPDTKGGLYTRQVADAIERGWGVEMQVVTPDDYARFRARMQTTPTLFASVSLRYGAFKGTSVYASRSGFKGNHQVGVLWRAGMWDLYDPLADGRSGVPFAPVRVSDALLRRACGGLVLNEHVGKTLGLGRIYVGYVQGPETPAPTKYSVRFGTKAFWLYGIQGDTAIDRQSKRFAKATSAPCAAPEWVRFGAGRKELARVTAGGLAGRYVEPGRSDVTLVTG